MFRYTASLLLIYLFFSSIIVIAQITDSAFKASLVNESICIQNEELNISFVGQKAEYIDVVFEKKASYEILDNKASLFPIELPEVMDPTYFPHGSQIENLNRFLDDIQITEFSVEVVKPEGDILKPSVEREEVQHRIINDKDRFGEIYSYRYSTENIDSGDIVNVNYSYSIRYKYNYLKLFSYRMFLHSTLPRKKFDLRISHHFDLEVDTFFINNSNPHKEITEEKIAYSWHLTNLPGCLDDAGARPHTDLPWFTITMKPYELLYMDFNSFRETFIPMWYYTSFAREKKLRSAVVDEQIGVKNKDNFCFDKLARRFKNMDPDDSTGIVRLRYFQRFMADSVTYYDDFSYYNGDENYMKDHGGKQLLGSIVKDHMKEFVYAAMIPKMDLVHFTAYPADKRSGHMSREYYAPVHDNELLFAVILNNNSIAFVLPKSDDRNLYFEELPFYYEDVPVILIYTYDFAGYKRNFNEIVRIINTPGSTITDNCRKTNCMGKVHGSDGSIAFTSKVSLSGQYSTLTRSIYNGQAGDSSIHPRYLQKLWETGAEVDLVDAQLNETSIYFPYKTSMDAKYRIKNIVTKGNNKISIDIGSWTKHIFFEKFSSSSRFTDFYTDFTGSDSYAFMLQFDDPVQLISPREEIHVDNEFATFTYSIHQAGPKQVLINSYFLTKEPIVESENIQLVEEVYKAIEKSEKLSLLLSLEENQ